jgi:hypothetical protein
MVTTAIIHPVHMMTAKVTRTEGVTKHMKVTKKSKDIRAVRVINRSMTITLDGKVKQIKRNTSKKQRRKGANTNPTMRKIHTERSMTSTKKGDMDRITKNTTNTGRRDIRRYSKAAENNIGYTSHQLCFLLKKQNKNFILNLETSVTCTGTLKITSKITTTCNISNK